MEGKEEEEEEVKKKTESFTFLPSPILNSKWHSTRKTNKFNGLCRKGTKTTILIYILVTMILKEYGK